MGNVLFSFDGWTATLSKAKYFIFNYSIQNNEVTQGIKTTENSRIFHLNFTVTVHRNLIWNTYTYMNIQA